MQSSKYLFIFVVVALSAPLFAATPEDQIKFRQSAMMYLRYNMGVIKKQVVTNPDAMDRQKVIRASKTIDAIAQSDLATLFNRHSATGAGWKKTKVKPAYFRESGNVQQKYRTFRAHAKRLVLTANNANATTIKRQFSHLLNACKSCHKAYRAKVR